MAPLQRKSGKDNHASTDGTDKHRSNLLHVWVAEPFDDHEEEGSKTRGASTGVFRRGHGSQLDGHRTYHPEPHAKHQLGGRIGGPWPRRPREVGHAAPYDAPATAATAAKESHRVRNDATAGVVSAKNEVRSKGFRVMF